MTGEEFPSVEARDRLHDRSRTAFTVLVRSPRAAFAVVRLTRSAADRKAAECHLRGWSALVVEAALIAVDGATLNPLDLPEPVEEFEVAKVSKHRRTRSRPAEAVDLSTLDGPVRELDGDEDLDGGRPS